MVLPLALSVVWNLMVVLFILVCAAIILIVLLQKGRGGGISAAFGGGGAGSLLGTKTGDFLTWVTICLVALFLILAVLMGKFMRPGMSTDLSSSPATQTTAPVAPVETDAAMPATEMPNTAVTESISTEIPVVDEAAGAVKDAAETPEETK